MPKIKLIALDLDGTLLNSQKEIAERNKKALAAARDRGVKVVLTTGRPLKAMDFLLHELGLADQPDEYALTFNGGLIQRNNGEVLDQAVLTYGQVHDFYDLTESLGIPLDAIHGGTVYQIQSDYESRYALVNPALEFEPVDFADLSSQYAYNKCVSCYEPEILDQAFLKIPEEMKERFGIFKSRAEILEFCPKDADKAKGLEKLIAILGLDREEVMTLGDEDNDYSMIAWAGLGVAMGNASERVKSVAKVVAPMTNDEDAVAWAIEKYVLAEE